MPVLIEAPPHSEIETVTEILHGTQISDPYRWLEDQDSPRTRKWIESQIRYMRAYLSSIPGRERIRERVCSLLDVETYDSLQKIGHSYLFRKRTRGQEQPCICIRQDHDGADEVLIDPVARSTGPYTSVRPLRLSPDGRFLLYEVKQGGERTGQFELFDLQKRQAMPEMLSRGYLRGFAFSSDSQSLYYVHEAVDSKRPHYCAAHKHVIGTSFAEDAEVFFAGEDEGLRLHIIAGADQIGFLVMRFIENSAATDFYLYSFESGDEPRLLIRAAACRFGPMILPSGHILAITDHRAPNFQIVEVIPRRNRAARLRTVVRESDSSIQSWAVSGNLIFVSYFRGLRTQVDIFDSEGKQVGQLPVNGLSTVRLIANLENRDELLFEQESFTDPIRLCSYSPATASVRMWASRQLPFNSDVLDYAEVRYRSKDGTEVPMFLVGRREVLENGSSPTIMTSYGGYGVPMSPQFSVFVAFLLDKGCVFALPNIRGGSEFGAAWHEAAKRRRRQAAIDDFLSAAEWLIASGRTTQHQLAIFGGSNSGLLVAAAMTQRPELLRAVLCLAPMADMLRYHMFDNAHVWKSEFGSADDRADFSALLGYSPYHKVRDGVEYPATMIVSGDADQNCNPMHARKMAARLQMANASQYPVLLDYSPHRGHSPVLPLGERIESLTDRLAFICEQLGLAA